MYLVASGHVFVDFDLVCLCEHWKGRQKRLCDAQL